MVTASTIPPPLPHPCGVRRDEGWRERVIMTCQIRSNGTSGKRKHNLTSSDDVLPFLPGGRLANHSAVPISWDRLRTQWKRAQRKNGWQLSMRQTDTCINKQTSLPCALHLETFWIWNAPRSRSDGVWLGPPPGVLLTPRQHDGWSSRAA